MSDRLTTIPVEHGQLVSLHEIALDVSRAEGRQVTLREVIAMLLTAWQERKDHA